MNVCFITSEPMPPREGIGHHIYYLAQHFLKQGVTPVVITRKRPGQTAFQEIDGIAVHRITAPFVPPFHLAVHKVYLQPFLRELTSQIDLFHVHLPLVPYLTLLRPTVVTIHSSLIEDIRYYEQHTMAVRAKALLTNTYYRRIYRQYLKRADALITVSGTVASELNTHFGVSAAQLQVIPNGVDSGFFTAQRQEKNPVVLFVGRLGERKGLEDYLTAAEYIYGQLPETRFRIAGEGPLREKLERRISSAPFAKQVEFLGWCSREKLQSLLQSATVFVFPSRYEAAPLTLLEALSAGLPIVATPVGNAPDVLEHDRNALIVPPASPERISQSVLRLLQDTELRQRLGKNARNTVIKKLTWQRVSEQTLHVYQQILEKS